MPAALQIGGFQGNSNYNLMVESLNYDELTKWAPMLEQAVAALPEVQEVSTNLEAKSPRVDLVIDRDKSAAVGLNATTIANALSTGLGPRWSTTIYGARSQYKVLLELDPKYQEQADSLTRIGFKTPAGNLVPLESVVKFKETVGAADREPRRASCRPCRSRSACGRACRSARPSITSIRWPSRCCRRRSRRASRARPRCSRRR